MDDFEANHYFSYIFNKASFRLIDGQHFKMYKS